MNNERDKAKEPETDGERIREALRVNRLKDKIIFKD